MKNIIRTPETHPLTWRLRDDKQPVWLDEYRSKNGYEGARKALTGLSPDEIVNQVKDAGLKGRGGAGFSTGLKWSRQGTRSHFFHAFLAGRCMERFARSGFVCRKRKPEL